MSNVAIVETAGTSRALRLPLRTLQLGVGMKLCSSENMLLCTSWKVSSPSVSRELKLLVFGLVILVVLFEDLR